MGCASTKSGAQSGVSGTVRGSSSSSSTPSVAGKKQEVIRDPDTASTVVAPTLGVACQKQQEIIRDPDTGITKTASAEQFKLRLKCSDGKQFIVNAGIVEDVMKAVAEQCKVHESCITLTAGSLGRRLDLDKSRKLSQIDGLINGSTVFATIDRDKFPEQLGPFATVVVPIDGRKFRFSDSSDSEFQKNGGMWTMLGKNVKALGFSFREHDVLVSQVSPSNSVTLTDAEKKEVNIPVEASQFCWSYHVPNGDQLGDATDLKATYFMKFGSFMYMNSKRWVLQATTLMPADAGGGGGLQFSRPRPWEWTWTKSLERAGRFQEVCVPDYRNVGATHYCWLKPGEKMIGDGGALCASQPDVEHGGFAYLFKGQKRFDRYFAIVSGDEYQMPKRADSQSFQDWSALATTDNANAGGVEKVKSDPIFQPSVDLTSFVAPNEWISGKTGLVKLTDPALVATFQILLETTHKQTDNWTRDRGCAKHGVNKCMNSCIIANKAPVPSKYTVVEILRNQNVDLWAKYCSFRDVISEECKKGSPPRVVAVASSKPPFNELGGSRLQPTEWRLFHGTSAVACDSICRKNFDASKGGTGSTWKTAGHAWGMPLYGFGHYFAENITKADEYTTAVDGVHSVLVCRVAGGRTKIVTQEKIDPKALEREVKEQRAFHSVYGDRVSVLGKPYREVVVYDNKQVFPEFLIKYRRN